MKMNINDVVMGKFVTVVSVTSMDIDRGISIGMVGELLESRDVMPYIKFPNVDKYALYLDQIKLIKAEL